MTPHDPGRLVARGIAWTTIYQVVESGLAFGTMLVLVRVIPPSEYGRFGAMVGLLAIVSCVSFNSFVAHALQLPDGQEPDWSLHWSAGLYIQVSAMLICHLLAGVCWLVPFYRPIAPLLHLAAFGFLLELPAQLRSTMLRRHLDFRRFRILLGLSVAVKSLIALAVGLAGGGAYAIVLGSNVLAPLPFSVDLLLVQRWRPRPSWWRGPDWRAYRPALRFGFQQAGSGILATARVAVEAAVLPATVGYAAIGLLGRARVLFSSTVGRTAGILNDNVYPLLPRSASNPALYARHVTLFAQSVCLIVVPGALYVGLEGPGLSRLLYGERWIAADPLIWPAAIGGFAVVLFFLASGVLLAASRLRACLALDAIAAAVLAPMVAVAWLGGGITAYAWAVAAGQVAIAVASLAVTSPLFAPAWARSVLLPPAIAGLMGAAAVLAIHRLGPELSLVPALAVETGAFGLAAGLTLRALFPSILTAVLCRFPGGERVMAWLRLPPAPAVTMAP